MVKKLILSVGNIAQFHPKEGDHICGSFVEHLFLLSEYHDAARLVADMEKTFREKEKAQGLTTKSKAYVSHYEKNKDVLFSHVSLKLFIKDLTKYGNLKPTLHYTDKRQLVSSNIYHVTTKPDYSDFMCVAQTEKEASLLPKTFIDARCQINNVRLMSKEPLISNSVKNLLVQYCKV